jgi:putative membrane protein
MPAYLDTLSSFATYFGTSLALTAVFLLLYTWITPYREMALIGTGNRAAAIGLGGAGLGFVLPLASAIAHSVSLLDMVMWGVVAMVVQLLVFAFARVLGPQLVAAITEDRMSVGIALAALSIGVGILNAACMTY